MPRPRPSSAAQLTPGQSAYVLERLISERRVSPGEVNRIISEMGREINDLESRLQLLREVAGASAAPARRGPGRPPGRPGRPAGKRRRGRPGRPPAKAAPAAAPKPAAKGRRRAAISAEQAASRQLQGRYLALVRRFPATKRAAFAKTAKEKGRESAIRDMQDALKK